MSTARVLLFCALGCARAVAVDAADPAVLQPGEQVFQKWCLPCHGEGRRHPGTLALQAKYNGSVPAELQKRTDLAPQTVRFYVRNGVSVMPFFRKTEISDEDLKALSAYLARRAPSRRSTSR